MPPLTPWDRPLRHADSGYNAAVSQGNRLRFCATMLLCYAYIMGGVAPTAQAWEVFTGFQMDNRKQYLAYSGVRVALTPPEGDITPFVQLFAFHQVFFFRSAGQLLQAQLTQVVPTLGVTKSMGQVQLGALAGPALRETYEDTVLHERERSRDIGYALQLEGTYWTDTDGFEGLVTYTSLDNFFFGRFRWKHPIVVTEGKLSFNLGLEGLTMGNSHVQEGLMGGLLEIQFGKLTVLVKGGYQNNTTFHSGGYGGLELYVPFGGKPNVDAWGVEQGLDEAGRAGTEPWRRRTVLSEELGEDLVGRVQLVRGVQGIIESRDPPVPPISETELSNPVEHIDKEAPHAGCLGVP